MRESADIAPRRESLSTLFWLTSWTAGVFRLRIASIRIMSEAMARSLAARHVGAGDSDLMRVRICSNRPRVIAASAICRTTRGA